MLDRLTASQTPCSGSPALTSTPGGYLIDVMIGNLHVHTPEPITEEAAKEYARLLWDSFGVEIDGDAPWI